MKLFTKLGNVVDKVLTTTVNVVVKTTKFTIEEVKNQLPKKEEGEQKCQNSSTSK